MFEETAKRGVNSRTGRMKLENRDSKEKKARLRVTKTLEPRQPGAIRLTRKYGDALLCVRYRQDAQGLQRYTTVELIVDATPIVHRGPRMVGVEIKLHEKALRIRACGAGAVWEPKTRLWRMPLAVAEALGIGDRIGK